MMADSIAVIGALEKEVRLIYDELRERTIVEGAGLSAVRGVYRGVCVTALTAGMGTVNAASAAQYLISEFDARTLIFSGIAGAINPLLRPGDVVIGETLRYLDTDAALLAECAPHREEFASTGHLSDLAERALEAAGYRRAGAPGDGARFLRGIVATGNRFIAEAAAREQVRDQTGADCVEMEGTAVAHVAAKNGVECLVLRAISDSCAESYDELSARALDLSRYARSASRLVLDIIAGCAARHAGPPASL